MLIKIDDTEIIVYPTEFSVTTLDIDNSDSSVRATDGTLSRDRVAVKRQIEMSWDILTWAQISSLLTAMSPVFFDLYYPDPMDGTYATRTFYVGNRPAPFGFNKDGTIMWDSLKVTLIEQ
jgi:hypothetical protein